VDTALAKEFIRRVFRLATAQQQTPTEVIDALSDDAFKSLDAGKQMVSFSHQAVNTSFQIIHGYSPDKVVGLIDFVRDAYDRAEAENQPTTPTVSMVLAQVIDVPFSRPDFSRRMYV
jgi:hypothetical protein